MSASTEKKRSGWTTVVIGVLVGIAFIWAGTSTGLKEIEPAILEGIDLNLGKVAVSIGAFLVMFPIIKVAFIGPLTAAIGERTRYLEDTFAEADSLKERMIELKTSYEQKLAESEAEARVKIQQAISDAQAMKDQILADARAQADEVRRKGEESIERERKTALLEMRTQVVEMTLVATEKLIGESMDEERQRKLVEKFIDTVEVGK